jgi:NAD(P)-dependent dehydrogenase (short-subunit alcohol dehydrogenase family)
MAKSILITGAGSGFGLMTARLAHARGWAVAATARRPAGVPRPCDPDEGRWLSLKLDVTDPGSVRDAVDTALLRFGRLDAVVSNAGVAHLAAAEEAVPGELRRELDTNFLGAVRLARAVLPSMRERGGGELVFVSSDLGRTGIPGLSGYCASKHALEGWAEALAQEVAPFGVGVTLVEPGGFATGFSERSMSRTPAASNPESPYAPLYEALTSHFFGGDAPTGEPVAEAILRAASGEEPRLRVPVGQDAQAWAAARFRPGEEEFLEEISRRFGWPPSVRKGVPS